MLSNNMFLFKKNTVLPICRKSCFMCVDSLFRFENISTGHCLYVIFFKVGNIAVQKHSLNKSVEAKKKFSVCVCVWVYVYFLHVSLWKPVQIFALVFIKSIRGCHEHIQPTLFFQILSHSCFSCILSLWNQSCMHLAIFP